MRGRDDRAGKVELLTGIEGASSRPVRRIVLIEADHPGDVTRRLRARVASAEPRATQRRIIPTARMTETFSAYIMEKSRA